MKKIHAVGLALLLSLAALSACQSSEQDKVEKTREEQGIESISNQEALEHIVEGKKTLESIYRDGFTEEELYDESGNPYKPFKEEYDSPEKIIEALSGYYSEEYAEELLSLIPADYIGETYALPVGDIGMIPNYDEFTIVNREDISSESIKVSYKTDSESEETFIADFEYIERSWKITDEIRQFDSQ